MTEHERLYALALALIPDEDVAGDIYMDAKDERSLRRAAAVWMQRQGLRSPAEDPPLPALTAEQVHHAHHLARRGELRRRFKMGALALLGLAAVGAVALVPRTLRGPALPVWARDPVYTAERIEWSPEETDVRLEVHKAVFTPGSISIWWALTGPGVAKQTPGSWPATVTLMGRSGRVVASDKTESAFVRRDRIVGYSTFQTPVGRPQVSFAVGHWVVPDLLLERIDDPDARMVEVNQEFPSAGRWVFLKRLTIGKNYTLIETTGTGLMGQPPQQLALYAAGRPLAYVDTVRADTGGLEELFEPIPDGVGQAAVSYPADPRLDMSAGKTTAYPLEIGQAGLVGIEHSDHTLTLRFRVSEAEARRFEVTVEDEAGNTYRPYNTTSTIGNNSGDLSDVRVRLTVPATARPVKLNRTQFLPRPQTQIEIPLPPE